MPDNSFLNGKKFPGYRIEIANYKAGSVVESPVTKAFFALYEDAFGHFPLAGENKTFTPNELLIVPDIFVIICTHNSEVIGGMILECYPGRYGFLRNIFTIPTYTDNGIETEFLVYLKKFVDEEVNDRSLSTEKRIVVLLFEAHADMKYKGIKYSSLADFYYRAADSPLLDLSYIEPCKGSDDYILGVIPTISSGNIREKLTISSYLRFLDELYRYTNPQKREFFLEKLRYRITNPPEQKIPIVEFPKLKNPKLQISKVSVAFHLIQASDEIRDTSSNYYCKIFNSYEKDLFSQRYVEKPPYFTKHIDTRQVLVNFDDVVQFTSEGREETFIFINDRGELLSGKELQKKANVFINHTYFPGTKKIIWTFVFSPVENFNEYEVIQLEKYFTGTQEDLNSSKGQTTDPTVSFEYGEIFFSDVISLANAMISDIGLEQNRETGANQDNNVMTFLPGSILAGAVQVDTNDIGIREKLISNIKPSQPASSLKMNRVAEPELREQWGWRKDVFQYFNSDDSSRKGENGIDKLDALYGKNDSLQYALNSFCGIALGIFDFERMSYEEVTDTLVPLASTDSYFLILNKSSITCFCDRNTLYASSLKYGIGMNPYIIIPNTVLAYNSFWAKQCEQQILNNPLEKRNLDSEKSAVYKSLKDVEKSTFYFLNREYIRQKRKLIRYYEETNDILSKGLRSEILNVFQYETEIEIYKAGMEKRGIKEKRTELERIKTGYEEELRKTESQRSNTFSILSIILSIISLTQIYQFVEEICKRLVGSLDSNVIVENAIENDPRVYLPALGSTLIFFVLFLFLFIRYYRGYHPESVPQ